MPTQQQNIPLVLKWESAEPHVLQWSESEHRGMLANPNTLHHLIIARKLSKPVGYAVLKKNSPDKRSVEFTRLVIGDEFRSQSYGTLYFVYVWDLVFSDESVIKIWHDVFADNSNAIRLYEKLGYERFQESVESHSGRKLFFYELTRQKYVSVISRTG